jgi:hypothetical protein
VTDPKRPKKLRAEPKERSYTNWYTMTIEGLTPHAEISYTCFAKTDGQKYAILNGKFTPSLQQETSRLIAIGGVDLFYDFVGITRVFTSKDSILIGQYLKNEINKSSKPDAVLMFNQIDRNLFISKKLIYDSKTFGDMIVPINFPLTGSVPFIVN